MTAGDAAEGLAPGGSGAVNWTTHEFAKHGARPCTVERVRAGKRFIAINGERVWVLASHVHETKAAAQLAAQERSKAWRAARGKAKPNNLETIDEGN